MKNGFRILLAGLCASSTALAADAPAASGAGAVMQMIGALGVVLTALFAVLWLLRRLSGGRLTGNAPIRTVGGIAVGSRERVVLLEIGEHWLVVGVAPGSVNGIATLPRGEISPAGNEKKPAAADFGALLAKLKAERP